MLGRFVKQWGDKKLGLRTCEVEIGTFQAAKYDNSGVRPVDITASTFVPKIFPTGECVRRNIRLHRFFLYTIDGTLFMRPRYLACHYNRGFGQ